MKHSISTTLVLLALFLSAQLVGIAVLRQYVDPAATAVSGTTMYTALPYDIQRPDINPSQAYIYLGIAIGIGTALLLLLMKIRRIGVWKLWYAVSITATLAIAWAAFIPQLFAGILAVIAAAFKVLRPNPIIHNFTELFIYAGLAAIFVPVLSISSAAILLVLISIYDIYAVNKSKHMVAIAQFQTSSRLFAGLAIPKTPSGTSKKAGSDNIAIIGGGDIGFPLLFTGAVMATAGTAAFIIPFFAAAGLSALFLISKKGKFYPAMPFVSAGCFLGYGVLLLL